MIPIRTLLVDDEPISIKNLSGLIRQLCPDLEIIGTSNHAEDALEKIILLKPELVFLDIELGGMSGFDILNKVSNRNFEVIFVTAYKQFGIDAVKAHALDYILKPINKTELLLSIENTISVIEKKRLNQSTPSEKSNTRLSLPTMEGLIFVDLADILYIEADGRYSRFHLNNKTKQVVSRNLGDYETQLAGKGFIRIHHQYIVNMNFIDKYIKGRGGYVILKNGDRLEVSIRKKDDFFDHFE
ncbi:MAG: response regulator transcription factor [Chitinophagaceae bacterium]|nr:response regulator transcription factor [Chitinophagaceae bacterium]